MDHQNAEADFASSLRGRCPAIIWVLTSFEIPDRFWDSLGGALFLGLRVRSNRCSVPMLFESRRAAGRGLRHESRSSALGESRTLSAMCGAACLRLLHASVAIRSAARRLVCIGSTAVAWMATAHACS